MKRWAIAIALFVCWSDAAAALACKSSPSRDTYHQYRIVDGKKCWYAGSERREKSELAWKSVGSRPVERFSGGHGSSDRAVASGLAAGFALAGTGGTGVEGSNPSRSTTPDFDAAFAHFVGYEVAHPVVHLLYPPRVSQAWGSKRVAVVLYGKPE